MTSRHRAALSIAASQGGNAAPARLRPRLDSFALDRVREAAYLLDEQGRILEVNEEACRALGYTAGELQRMTLMDIDPDRTPETGKRNWPKLRAEGSLSLEARHRRKDGSVFPVAVKASYFEYEGRAYNLALARDITEQKQAEAEHREHLRFLETMDKVNRAIQGANEIEQVLAGVLDVVLSAFECDRALLIHPCDPAAASWSVQMERNLEQVTVPASPIPMDAAMAALFQAQLESDGPVRFSGVSDALPAALGAGSRRLLSLALHPKTGKPWLLAIRHCGEAPAWAPEAERLFVEIGRRLADGLTGLLAYRNLRASEREYRTLAENAPTHIGRYDVRCRLIYANSRLVALLEGLGIAAHEVIGKTPVEHTDDAPSRVYQACLEEVIATGLATEMERTLPDRSGGHQYHHIQFVAERDECGNIVGALAMGRDVTARVQAECQLHESRRQLRRLATRREAAREEERRRIARELHDELGQQLTALRFGVSLLDFQVGSDLPAVREAAAGLLKLVERTIQTTRDVSSSLRPAALDMGILPALESLAAEHSRRSGMPCDLALPQADVCMDEGRAIAVFRIVQESLTNAARHSRASRVSVSFAVEPAAFVVEVCDDGVGFDADDTGRPRSYGLIGIRERALALEGDAEIMSVPGQGTRVRVRIPAQRKGG